MRITFELNYDDRAERKLQKAFCETVVDSIRTDITDNTNVQKVKAVSDKIVEFNWISWIGRPRDINPYFLLNFIASNINYSHVRDDIFTITINPIVRYPGSRTRLSEFVRFLDKGNMIIRGSGIFSGIFNKYAKDINKLWSMFKSNKLKRYQIDNSFVVK